MLYRSLNFHDYGTIAQTLIHPSVCDIQVEEMFDTKSMVFIKELLDRGLESFFRTLCWIW